MKRPPRKKTRGWAGTLSLTHKPSLSYLLLLRSLLIFQRLALVFPPQLPEAPTPDCSTTPNQHFIFPTSLLFPSPRKTPPLFPSYACPHAPLFHFHIALASACLWYIQNKCCAGINLQSFCCFFIYSTWQLTFYYKSREYKNYGMIFVSIQTLIQQLV